MLVNTGKSASNEVVRIVLPSDLAMSTVWVATSCPLNSTV